SKYEIRRKSESEQIRNLKRSSAASFGIWCLVLPSDFVLRISDLSQAESVEQPPAAVRGRRVAQGVEGGAVGAAGVLQGVGQDRQVVPVPLLVEDLGQFADALVVAVNPHRVDLRWAVRVAGHRADQARQVALGGAVGGQGRRVGGQHSDRGGDEGQ